MPIQFADEECLQNVARKMEDVADGYQNKRKWNWTRIGKSESHDFC